MTELEKATTEYRNFRESCGYNDPVALNEIESAFFAGAEWQKEQFNKIENYQEEGWYSSGDDEYVYGISFEEPVKLPVEFYVKKN